MSDGALVQLRALEAGYDARAILPPIDLTVSAGQTWALIGRNGAGKSTLLRTLIGLQRAVRGEVVMTANLQVGFVAQRGDFDSAVPGRVVDLVRSGADREWSFLSLRHPANAAGLIQSALEDTDTLALAERPYAELSVGQQQRVNIARAFVGQPNLLVLDEPTSAMDPTNERAVFELLDHLRERHGTAILIASHVMSFVPRYASHAILVDAHEGLARVGPKDEILACDAFLRRYGAIFGEARATD